jgi:hypothetical protein
MDAEMGVELEVGAPAPGTPARGAGAQTIALDRGTAIKVTPLYGVQGEDPLCYLLEMDGCNILLDCGWNDTQGLTLVPISAQLELFYPPYTPT